MIYRVLTGWSVRQHLTSYSPTLELLSIIVKCLINGTLRSLRNLHRFSSRRQIVNRLQVLQCQAESRFGSVRCWWGLRRSLIHHNSLLYGTLPAPVHLQGLSWITDIHCSKCTASHLPLHNHYTNKQKQEEIRNVSGMLPVAHMEYQSNMNINIYVYNNLKIILKKQRQNKTARVGFNHHQHTNPCKDHPQIYREL